MLTSTQQADFGTCQARPNGKPRATPAVTGDQVDDVPTWPKVCSLLGGPAPFHSHKPAEPENTSPHGYSKEKGTCSGWRSEHARFPLMKSGGFHVLGSWDRIFSLLRISGGSVWRVRFTGRLCLPQRGHGRTERGGVGLPGALCLSFPTQTKRPTSQGYLQTRLEARLERWVRHGQDPFSPSSRPVAWPLPSL